MTKLRILSNNLWFRDDNAPAWEAHGESCSAEARAPGFVRTYLELKPDVIGLQECSAKMAALIMQGLAAADAQYALLWARDTPILYRPDRFELADSAFRIYPEEVPGYEGSFNNAQTKSYCIAVLREKASAEMLIFASTHLWWKSAKPAAKNYQPHSDEARTYQLGLVMDHVDQLREKYGCPAVIAGDFNAVPSSQTVQSAYARGYLHAHDTAAEYADERNGHHFCFADGYDYYEAPRTFAESIDQMIHIGAPEGFVRRFDRFTPDFYMPLSDHFPMWADVELGG